MSNWNLPATGGHMEKQDGIYCGRLRPALPPVRQLQGRKDVLRLPEHA